MYRKKLLTAALCAALVLASCSMGGGRRATVSAGETEVQAGERLLAAENGDAASKEKEAAEAAADKAAAEAAEKAAAEAAAAEAAAAAKEESERAAAEAAKAESERAAAEAAKAESERAAAEAAAKAESERAAAEAAAKAESERAAAEAAAKAESERAAAEAAKAESERAAAEAAAKAESERAAAEAAAKAESERAAAEAAESAAQAETQTAQTEPQPAQPGLPGETQPQTSGETQPQTEMPGTSVQNEPQTETPGASGTGEPQTETAAAPGESEAWTEAPGAFGESETQTEAPGLSEESEARTGTSGDNQTETGTEADTQEESGEKPETEDGTESGKSTEEETESESETDPETEEESEPETSLYGSNEELVAHQNIVIPLDLTLEFRFTQVEKRYALANVRGGIAIYEEKSEDAREVGELEYYGLCYILEDREDGWYYVESGNVRGFVKAEEVALDEVAERIVSVKGEEKLPSARLVVARSENKAFTYTHTTVQEVLAEKRYALAEERLEIREQRKASSRTIGTLPEGGLCYILADADKDWIYVESGDVRGFVRKEQLLTGSAASRKVASAGEKNLALAEEAVAPEDNKSCYYTLTSVQEASQEARTREAMVNFAKQFLGNPYVWGGTSLTNGCDCSGFVQSIYANFGYSLPRVADAQSVYGMQIPISSAEPGDLIFYARKGYVYHVSMYIGNGQVIHAAGKNLGIITSGISGNAVWATRVITG